MCLISRRYIKKEEEVRTGKILDRIRRIGEEIGHLVENEVIIVIEVMDKVEAILEEVVFKVGPVVILEETMVGIKIRRQETLETVQIERKKNESYVRVKFQIKIEFKS